MRKTVILLCVVAAALAAPAEHAAPPAHAPAPARPAQQNPHVAHAQQAPHRAAAEKQGTASHLEPLEAKAEDDLKPDESHWGLHGWGYQPVYYKTYSYYTPRVYYTVPTYHVVHDDWGHGGYW